MEAGRMMHCGTGGWLHWCFLSVLIACVLRLTAASTHDSGYGHRHDRPIFRPTETNLTYGPGDTATLKCCVENLGTKSVTWRKEGDIHPLTIDLYTFVSDTRISVDYKDRANEWSLVIESVKPEDEGVYHCTVVTQNPHDNTYKIQLNVKTVLVDGDEFVEKSRPLHLTCNATGKPDPPHDVTWYHKGIEIDSNAQRGVLITKKIDTRMLVSVLVIEESQLSDSGEYVCRSSNGDYARRHVEVIDVALPLNPTKRESRVGSGNSGTRGNAQPVHSNAQQHVTVSMVTVLLMICSVLTSHWTLAS